MTRLLQLASVVYLRPAESGMARFDPNDGLCAPVQWSVNTFTYEYLVTLNIDVDIVEISHSFCGKKKKKRNGNAARLVSVNALEIP